MKKFLAIAAITLAGCLSCIGENEDGVKNYVVEGDEIPSFTVTHGSGSGKVEFKPSDFAGMRSAIVLFQSSCGDCQREMPKVFEAWDELRKEGDFQLIAISRAESASTVGNYWSSETSTKPPFGDMPYYLDPDRSVFNKFANSYVPRIYLVGPDGKVQYMAIEKFNFSAAGLVDLINGLE